MAPVNVLNSTKITVVPSDANVEPKIFYSNQNNTTNETKTVMIDNARSTYPVTIDSTAKNVTYLNPNSIYIMQEDEKYVNSVWMWPEGMAPPGYPQITTFTVLFEKSGTYGYMFSTSMDGRQCNSQLKLQIITNTSSLKSEVSYFNLFYPLQ